MTLSSKNSSDLVKAVSLVTLCSLKFSNDHDLFESELNRLLSTNGLPTLCLSGLKLAGSSGNSDRPVDIENKVDTNENYHETPSRPTKSARNEEVPTFSNMYQPENLNSLQVTDDPVEGTNLTPSDPWIDFELFKLNGTKTNTPEEILAAWESKSLIIRKKNGCAPDFNQVADRLATGTTPKIKILKKIEFNGMLNSPRRSNRVK